MSKEQIRYRKATATDMNLLVEWRIKFLKVYFKNKTEEINRKLETETRKYLEKAVPAENYITWLAEINKNIVSIGALAVYYLPPMYTIPNGKAGLILNIYTIPEARKMGLCTTILDKLIEEAKNKDIHYLRLHASTDGVNIYKNAGFKLMDDEYCLKL